MRAVIYTRMARDGTATDRQRAECEALAASRGWDVVRMFSDSNVSASRYARKPRPGFDELMRALDDRAADVVVVSDVDRLTRSTIELAGVLARCEEAGIGIVTVHGDVDTSTPDGKMRAQIMTTVLETEADQRSERIRAAKAHRAKTAEPKPLREARQDLDAARKLYARGRMSQSAFEETERGIMADIERLTAGTE